jgi:hypothetical protein
LVQDTPCGGQVVLSSDTLSALTGTGSSAYGAIIHLGAHILEDNIDAHKKMFSGDASRPLDPSGGERKNTTSGIAVPMTAPHAQVFAV